MVIYCKMLRYASEISSFIKIILDRTNLVFIPTLKILLTFYILCLFIYSYIDRSHFNLKFEKKPFVTICLSPAKRQWLITENLFSYVVVRFNTIFNNISVISWRSVLLVEKSTDLLQVTDKLCNIMLYWLHLTISRIQR